MDWYLYPILALGGLFAGAINTIAGGGSLITLPLMIFAGVPGTVANGTNRIGVAVQSLFAVATFRGLGVGVEGLGPRLLVPGAIGTVIGAGIAVAIDERVFRLVLGLVMLVMGAFLAIDKRRWLRPEAGEPRAVGPLMWLGFVGIGIYAGFLQAGVGLFLIATLVLGLRLDLVRANAVKVWVVFGYTVVALAVFAWGNLIDLEVGLVVAAGQAVGGWLGARLTVLKGSGWVRAVLVCVVVVSGAELLGVLDWLWGLVAP